MNEYEVKVEAIETHYLIINADNKEDAVEQAENYGVNSLDAFSTDVEASVVKEKKMKTFKVIRSWTGFSEITVQAENEEQAKLLVEEGEYDTDNEVSTGNGLDYGYNNEETIDVQEIEENQDDNTNT